jgi:biopolymer transport protein TolR
VKALQRRAARRARSGNLVDMNLVSLIDVFTILIFFLLAHSLDGQTLSTPAGVHLPEARSLQPPRDGIELVVSGSSVLLKGQVVGSLQDGGLAALPAALRASASLDRAGGAGVAGVVGNAGNVGNAGGATGEAGGTAVPAQPLVLLADRELPYHWLSALLRAAAEAGLGEVSFAVRQQEGA